MAALKGNLLIIRERNGTGGGEHPPVCSSDSLFCFLFFFTSSAPFSAPFHRVSLSRFARDQAKSRVSHLRTLQSRFCGFCPSEAYFRRSSGAYDHVPVIKKFPTSASFFHHATGSWPRNGDVTRRGGNVAEAVGPKSHRVRINNREFNNERSVFQYARSDWVVSHFTRLDH